MSDALLWQTRASAWEFLALSFRYPERQLAEIIVSGEWVEAAIEISNALGLALPDNFKKSMAPYEGVNPDALLPGLRVEATRLFVGSPEPVVSPYEGVHRAAADGVAALLFVNPHSMDVERFMKSYGVGQAEGKNEPLDYVATECELLEYFAACECNLVNPVAAIALPDKGWAGAYRSFLLEHASIWMPEFARVVQQETSEPFYHAAAKMLAELVCPIGELS